MNNITVNSELFDLHVNLNTGGLSVLGTKKPYYGKVVKHCDTARVYNPTLRVRQGGNARAVKEKRRNVHAFVRGVADTAANVEAELKSSRYRVIRYNPFMHDYFFDAENEKKVIGGEIAVLKGKIMKILNPIYDEQLF